MSPLWPPGPPVGGISLLAGVDIALASMTSLLFLPEIAARRRGGMAGADQRQDAHRQLAGPRAGPARSSHRPLDHGLRDSHVSGSNHPRVVPDLDSRSREMSSVNGTPVDLVEKVSAKPSAVPRVAPSA